MCVCESQGENRKLHKAKLHAEKWGPNEKGKQSGAGVGGGGIREPPKCYPAEREKEKRGTEGALRGTLTLLPSFSSYTTFRSSFFFLLLLCC